MEINGLDSVKCQKSRRGDISGIFELLMIIRQKSQIVIFFSNKKETKNVLEQKMQ